MRYVVHPKSQKNITASTRRNMNVYAAGEDDLEDEGLGDEGFVDPGDADLYDTLDDVADTVEDIQDTVDEIEEDDVDIQMNNNITGHYIAECDGCGGVFISATIESDQEVEKVSGVCPLCEKETDQYLKWVIRDAKNNPDDELETL